MRYLSHWRTWPSVVIALLLLNTSLTFENVWPTPRIRWVNALSVELAVCVLLLALAHPWATRFLRRTLPAIWVVLVAGHYADVTAPGLYGREFNLYWDSQHLSNVAAMLGRAAPWWLIALAITVAVLVVGAAYAVARLAIGRLATAMAVVSVRRSLVVVAVTVVMLFAAQRTTWDPALFIVSFADPVTPAYVRQARTVAAMVGPGVVAPALAPSPSVLASPLLGLDGADVLLVFVESYGAITYDRPAFAETLGASRRALHDAVRDTGRHVVSAFVQSPTFGGSSWLAHLSLLSGVEVRDPYAYASLMTEQRDTIVTTFARQGYRTVAMMPGMRQAWPEGAFYGLDVIYGRTLLEYQGPQFGWWGIPDQYTLAKLDALERDRASRAPVFVWFPTSTTHAPFGPVAPYQPDWARVLTATPYDPAEVERVMAISPDLTNLSPSYAHAMAYEFESLAGYIRENASDNLVMILVGDHQPPAAVSGKNASWDVPVHVIASRKHLTDRLLARGFSMGLTPQRASLGEMHELVPMLLTAFASPAHGIEEARISR